MAYYHIINAKILNEDFEITAGEIKIAGNIISETGKNLTRDNDYEIIDAGGNLVMPGLKNAHTHSAMTLLRGYAEDLPLESWLFKKVFPFEACLTEEDVYWGTKLALLEYIRNGTTAIGEMYMFADSYFKAFSEDGFRVTGIGAISDIGRNTEEQLLKLEKLYNTYNNSGETLKMMLGYHAEYTASDALLGGLSELSKALRAPVCAHMSETKDEVINSVKNRGEPPFKLAVKSGLFDYGGVIYHAVHLDTDEMKIAGECGVYAVTNPSSNLKLSSGIASICEMKEQKIKIAVGTDGAASNNALDMFREMYLAAVLQKYKTGDPSVMPSKDILNMCIVNGAGALGNGDSALKKGNAADLIIVDINVPNMRPHHNITNNLVYSATGSNVVFTMINGKILYNKGKFYLKNSPEQIYNECDRIIERIKSSL